ncbi:tyrosine-type recombinase/integrase [Geomonas diazotrophica]|uniref:tyrosine-type recombinase/integrase n=1 Tax=Geomonas diazotrophica TaxID=2843197 RepID=UPI001F1AB465|nr:site-specific integrase [Geomonas diazotrophica]
MFTDRQIRNLKPENRIRDIREGRGFGIRIKPNGGKIFFYGYDSPVTGARRFLTLGEYPELSLEAARMKHADVYRVVKSGGDPLEAAQQEQKELKEAPTLKELGEDYLKRYAQVNKRSWHVDKRILEKEVYPHWGRQKAQDITKRHVIALLDRVVDRGAPQSANSIFKVLRKMFNWAVRKDILKTTPCIGIDMPAPLRLKDRALTAEEIRTVWHGLENGTMITADAIRAIKLVLVTAQRPGEITGMHTSEIENGWWTIPSERAKNGKAHRVPLSPLALELIEESIEQNKKARQIPQDEEFSGYIFPCPHRNKDKPIERHALSKALKRNQAEDGTVFGVAAFTPHDLRRTAATFMAEAGEMDEVIDAVLSHSKQGIIRVYNQFKYDAPKKAALESWSRRLTSIITGVKGNVVPLVRKVS